MTKLDPVFEKRKNRFAIIGGPGGSLSFSMSVDNAKKLRGRPFIPEVLSLLKWSEQKKTRMPRKLKKRFKKGNHD